MNQISRATPLYEFLRLCNESTLERIVLDCGAGGENPPLSLFYQAGYKTFGIEIAEKPLGQAKEFCRKNEMDLNIINADMRHIPFINEQFGFAYSFNAIFFMTKPDIAVSMSEMARVLKPGGLCYVNFKSIDDPDDRTFCKSAFTSRLLGSTHFARFEDDEADRYFDDFEILLKEKRCIDRLFDCRRLKTVLIQYIGQKNQ